MSEVSQPETDPWRSCLEQIAAGEVAALERLYDAFAPRLMGIAYRILGQMPDAEDALAGALVEIWRGSARFEPAHTSAETWVLLTVRRHCIERLRQRPRRPAPAADLEVAPPRERDALELSFFDGYSAAEIAVLKTQPLDAVKAELGQSLESPLAKERSRG